MQCFMLMAMGDGLAHYHITVFVLDYASPAYGHKTNKMMSLLCYDKVSSLSLNLLIQIIKKLKF